MFRALGNLFSSVTRMGRTNHDASKLTGKPRSQGYTSPTAQYQQRPRDLPPLGFDMIRADGEPVAYIGDHPDLPMISQVREAAE